MKALTHCATPLNLRSIPTRRVGGVTSVTTGRVTAPRIPGEAAARPADPRMFLLGMALWLTAACGSATPATGAPSAAAPGPDLVPAVLQVPVRMMQPPFDRPRQTLVPAGWTMSLWARVPGARLASWAPDGTLLVSRPSAGQVVRLSPAPDGLESTVLLGGLAQPYGLAFAGDTLYVAESDEIVGYQYHAGVAAGRHVVVDGLPDQRSPELGGAYAHALKSVAVGPDASCCRRTWPTTPSRNWRG